MACPICGGDVYFGSDPVAVRYVPEREGALIYFKARCDSCGWTGHGSEWFRDSDSYVDGVELPIPGKNVLRR